MQEWNQDWKLLESSGWVLVTTGLQTLDLDFSSLLKEIWRQEKFFFVSQSFSFLESAEFYWWLPQQSLGVWNSRIRKYHNNKKRRENLRALQIKESHHQYFKIIVLVRKRNSKSFSTKFKIQSQHLTSTFEWHWFLLLTVIILLRYILNFVEKYFFAILPWPWEVICWDLWSLSLFLVAWSVGDGSGWDGSVEDG